MIAVMVVTGILIIQGDRDRRNGRDGGDEDVDEIMSVEEKCDGNDDGTRVIR